MPMKHYIIIRDEINQIEKLIVNDMDKAKTFVANIGNRKFTHKGRKVEVLGLYDEDAAKTIEMFHHTGPTHYDQWRQNMLHFKKTKKWPDGR